MIDATFIIDLIINFRTMAIQSHSNILLKDCKSISKKYITSGRFFVDLIASLPIESLSEALGANVSSGTLKLFKLLKLVRLLRLGKIFHYLRMRKSIKTGIKFGLLTLYLILVLHWIDMFNYFAILEHKIWVPAKDESMETTQIYTNYSIGYLDWFYYACLFLLGNDSMPLTTSETLVAFFSVFVGTLTIGVLVAQFVQLINQITKFERAENELYEYV